MKHIIVLLLFTLGGVVNLSAQVRTVEILEKGGNVVIGSIVEETADFVRVIKADDDMVRLIYRTNIISITQQRDKLLTISTEKPSNTQMFYISNRGKVKPFITDNGFGANIVSNRCEDKVGTISFDADIASVGKWAFFNNKALVSITIPAGIKSIGVSAFAECTSLISVYLTSLTPPAGGISMFHNTNPRMKIYVPEAAVDTYKSADLWRDYAHQIEGYKLE